MQLIRIGGRRPSWRERRRHTKPGRDLRSWGNLLSGLQRCEAAVILADRTSDPVMAIRAQMGREHLRMHLPKWALSDPEFWHRRVLMPASRLALRWAEEVDDDE